MPRIAASHFELKTNFLHLLLVNQFAALRHHDALVHVEIFLDLCDTITMDDVLVDYIRLKAFKFSLDGPALVWFKALAPRSIFT